jgi:hypothetical protein
MKTSDGTLSEIVPYGQATIDLCEAHAAGLRAFVGWLQAHWRHDTEEQWQNEGPWPGPERERGWNEAIATLDGALDCYMGESGAA